MAINLPAGANRGFDGLREKDRDVPAAPQLFAKCNILHLRNGLCVGN
jgi:hypothetical protein